MRSKFPQKPPSDSQRPVLSPPFPLPRETGVKPWAQPRRYRSRRYKGVLKHKLPISVWYYDEFYRESQRGRKRRAEYRSRASLRRWRNRPLPKWLRYRRAVKFMAACGLYLLLYVATALLLWLIEQ